MGLSFQRLQLPTAGFGENNQRENTIETVCDRAVKTVLAHILHGGFHTRGNFNTRLVSGCTDVFFDRRLSGRLRQEEQSH